MNWYLFLIEVDTATPQYQISAQIVKSYADRATADADGAAMCSILNNSLRLAPTQKMVWAVAYF